MNEDSQLKGLGELNLTYFVPLDTVLADHLGDAIDSKSDNVRYLAEYMILKQPGVADVLTRSVYAKKAGYLLDIETLAEDAAQLSIQAVHSLAASRIVHGIKQAKAWIEHVRTFLPALDARIDRCHTSKSYEYDYVVYSTLVEQEAFVVLSLENVLREIKGPQANRSLAVAVLVDYWEQVHQTDATAFDKLIKD